MAVKVSTLDYAANQFVPKLTIDGREVALEGERNILELARKAGIDIPNFCYHSELSVYGACRLCLVEIEGRGLVASCSAAPEAGMAVRTNTPRTRRLRRMTLELLLANHDRECTTCDKSGSCRLQELANRLGVREVRFGERDEREPLDLSSPSLVRDPNKCILCGDCVRMCQEVQGIGVIDFAYRGSRTAVIPAFDKGLAEVDCVNCGQCAQVCPTGALTVKSETDRVWAALHDPAVTVVAQIAPAVRVALGEMFGLEPGTPAAGKTVAALKALGFDRVFDTNFAADLTAWEETHEFLRRRGERGRLPLFTSCCPAWVKYCEQYHADMLDNVSTCRSPQQMMGSLLKSHWAPRQDLDPGRLFVVSLMPCTAKKYEAARPELAGAPGRPDVDCVLSTRELASMIKEAGLDLRTLEEDTFDSPLGLASGAAVIFGATGGVSEAVVRTVAGIIHGQDAPRVDFIPVRGQRGLKEATVKLGGDVPGKRDEVRIAVVHGLANAGEVVRAIKEGRADYDIVEVMACPGGCVGGGGQPATNAETRAARSRGLYRIDRQSQLHRPQDNPHLARLYREWLGEAGSATAHEHLHTHYHPHRRISGVGEAQPACGTCPAAAGHGAAPASAAREAAPAAGTGPLEVSVCVGTGCYLRGSYLVLREFSRLVSERGLADKVKLGATFCLEKCDRGVSVKVGGRVVTGVSPESAGEVFEREIGARTGGATAAAGK
jgi:NADH-quinone oxidoreductase subunit G